MRRLAQRTILDEIVNLLSDCGQCTAFRTATDSLVEVGFGCVVWTTRVCAMVGRNNIKHSSAACTTLCAGIGDIESTYRTTGHDGTPPSYINLGCCNSRHFKYRREQAERQGGEGDAT